MAAQVPKSFLVRLSTSKKPFKLYKSRFIVWVLLSMGTHCPLEIHSCVQTQPDIQRSRARKSTATKEARHASRSDSLISEYDCLRLKRILVSASWADWNLTLHEGVAMMHRRKLIPFLGLLLLLAGGRPC